MDISKAHFRGPVNDFDLSSFVFRETLMTHLLLWGNAYAQVIRNGKGEVIALYPLMPNRMTVDRDENGQLYYSYRVSNDEANTMGEGLVNLRPEDVLHIPGLGFDGLVGYSPIAMAKNTIGMAIACEERTPSALRLQRRSMEVSSLQTAPRQAACWSTRGRSRIRAASEKAGSRPLADPTTVTRSPFWKKG